MKDIFKSLMVVILLTIGISAEAQDIERMTREVVRIDSVNYCIKDSIIYKDSTFIIKGRYFDSLAIQKLFAKDTLQTVKILQELSEKDSLIKKELRQMRRIISRIKEGTIPIGKSKEI